jgi:hypothetical protein
MKRFHWQIIFGLSLIALSTLFYVLHYSIFRDSHHIFLYLIGDIAFLPIQVLLVTLIIDRLLNERERSSLLKKLNMVIGPSSAKLEQICSSRSLSFHHKMTRSETIWCKPMTGPTKHFLL